MHTLKLERDGGRTRISYPGVSGEIHTTFKDGPMAEVLFEQQAEGVITNNKLTLENDDRLFEINEAGETVDAIYPTQKKPRYD